MSKFSHTLGAMENEEKTSLFANMLKGKLANSAADPNNSLENTLVPDRHEAGTNDPGRVAEFTGELGESDDGAGPSVETMR